MTAGIRPTKTWEIAAFQDSLKDVEVTFTVQSRLKNPNLFEGFDNGWKDTDETTTVDGWLAETLTKDFSATMPQYDDQGRELEYRWVETGVSLKDQETNFQRDDNGGGTFTLTLQNDEGNDEELQFTSTLDPETNTITNTFKNVTEEHVDKYWEQPDGSLAQVKPQDGAYTDHPDLDTSGIATVQLFQNGKLVGTFEMNGTADTQAASIKGLDGATYQETRSYHLDFENLPKYDERGVLYSYLVLEANVPNGWYSDRSYDAESHTTRIDNRIGEGESSKIRIIKDWNDGNDSQHRLPVAVDLVATKHIESDAKNADGTPRYSYEAGQAVNASPIILTGDEAWYTEYEVPIGGLTYKDFKVVELYMIGTDNEGKEVHYPVVDSSEAKEAYADLTQDIDWINTGWDFDATEGTERVATPDHVYEVSATAMAGPTYNEDVGAVTATNRRLGLLDLTVEKTWKDQGEHTRPVAQLVLTSTDYPDAFSKDDDGNVWVKVSDNQLPVLDNVGAQLNTKNTNAGEGSASVTVREATDGEPSAVIITVNTAETSYESTYYFFGLPKYDANGNVVHYDVNEEWPDGNGKYTPIKKVGDYRVGTRHFHDTQTISFTNTRQGTRDVTFNKLWQDQYVNASLRQRPDISLTLYRVTVGVDDNGKLEYSEPQQVEGYVHYLWTGTESADNPEYQQSCTISGLPAYDKDGSEYIYYASESMAADGSSLNYADVRFDFADMKTMHAGENPEPQAVRVPGAEQKDENFTENGTGWAIREGGTLVNALSDNLVANGTKLWKNTPGNVSQASSSEGGTMLADTDLPDVTIYLQRRVEDEDWPSLTFTLDAETGEWKPSEGGAVAWTSDLKRVTTNQYSYQITHTGENTAESAAAAIDGTNPDAELLPRFTKDGELYEYRAIEVVWGLLDQPGGFTSGWVTGGDDGEPVDFSAIRDDGDNPEGVYVIEHGETGSFLINNTYNSEKGNLTVQKHYTGRKEGDLYPDTTFDVYRYYVKAGEPSEPELVTSKTLTNDMLKAENPETLDGLEVTGAGEATTTAKYTFKNLDIYAPDGSYWQYYVVEHNINGYTTTVGKGDLAVDNDQLATGDIYRDAASNVIGMTSGPLCKADAQTGKVLGTVLGEVNDDGAVSTDETPDVTFKNDYTPGNASLSGTKTWNDFDNIFNLRPTTQEFLDGLKVERISTDANGDGAVEVLKSGSYTLSVDQAEDSSKYTITLSGIPIWAPDGTAYRYRITEMLGDMVLGGTTGSEPAETAEDYYTASNKTSTVDASTGNRFSFTNSLNGQASVEKTWVDGNDPYGLRPTSVTVRLQARYSYVGDEAAGSDQGSSTQDEGTDTGTDAGDTTTETPTVEPGVWDDPVDILNELEYWNTFVSQFASESDAEKYFEKTLDADHGWKASWTDLPTAGRGGIAGGHSGVLFTIDYRVVEVKIGDQEIEQPFDVGEGEKFTFKYKPSESAGYHPYQPAQDSWTNENGKSTTVISNTLEGTSIAATKSWEGDTVDEVPDAWGTRPGGDNWSVTYLLQRRLKSMEEVPGGEEMPGSGGASEAANQWQWVMKYGTDQAGPNDPLNENIVSQTIDADDAGGKVTWANLPKYDTSGNEYEYLVVERVPGSYDVTNGTLVTTATDEATGVTYRFYVVESKPGSDENTPASQTFTNTLRTTTLTGTKVWDDHGTGIADGLSEEDMPELVLYRATQTAGTDGKYTYGDAEQVKLTDGTVPQPTWSPDDEGGAWTFTYAGLPAANENDVEYVYWAVEEAGEAPGYYPLYGSTGSQAASSHGASGTTVKESATASDPGEQTNETITNVATQLTLSKVSDFANDTEDFTGVELRVTSPDGVTTYARWIKTADGAQTYTWVGGTEAPESTDNAVSREDGLIVGLAAGNYRVSEVASTVPEGHAIASPIDFEIKVDGTAVAKSSVTTSDDGNVHTVTVTATDPVLRAHLKLAKYVSEDGTVSGNGRSPLAGAKFDLYCEGYDDPVVTGLVSDASGVVATNSTDNSGLSLSDSFVSAHEGKYTTLADGLPEGTYYFVETDATPGAVLPSGDAARSESLTVTQNSHYATAGYVSTSMENKEFTAQVTLHKYDAATQGALDGAVFSVSYVPEGSTTAQTLPDVTTADDGSLTLTNLKKGTYTVTEKSNTGYDVTEPFSATFVIGNEDHGGEFDITSADYEKCQAAEDIDFQTTPGSYTDDKGIPNTPLRGTVTMTKVDEDGTELDGATFELQQLADDGQWQTVVEGLVTGQNYSLNDENTAVDGSGSAGTEGQISVTNLLWGTYRFQETTPAPGYFGQNTDGSALTTDQAEINRTNGLDKAVSAGTVSNGPTSLEVNKQNDVGQPLEGAEFQIAAQGETEFADVSAFAEGTYDPDTKTVTLSTDSTGHIELTGQLLVGGTYTIYESKGPSGYDPADGVLTIEVQADGSLEVQGDMPDRYEWADLNEDGQADDTHSFMVTNTHEEIDLRKVSASNPDLPVDGAEFVLTGYCMDNNTSHTYTTDEDGCIHIDAGLISGVPYTLNETSPGPGYIARTDALHFTMDERGEIQVTDAQGNPLAKEDWPAGYSVDEGGISFTVTDEPVGLQITKLDPNGEGLFGAVFSITPVAGSTFADGRADAQTLSTGMDGSLFMGAKLVVGNSYDITEVSAPEGYERVTGTMRVTVGADGSINVLGSVDESGNLTGTLPPTGYEKVAGNTFEVQVTNEPIEIGIAKVDASDTATALPGAAFEVTGRFADERDPETRTYTTDADGHIDIAAELIAGETYTLRETVAPAGYKLIEGEFTFSVADDGTVTAQGDAPTGYTIEQGNVTIAAADEPIEVLLDKRDLGDAPLAGAEFTIAGTFVNTATHETAELEIPLVTTGAAASLSRLSHEGATYGLVAGGTYTLTETAAPSGYETIAPFSFTVDERGDVAAANGSAEAAPGTPGVAVSEDGGVVMLTAHDRPIEVTLRKTDGTAPLAGVSFELLRGSSAAEGVSLGEVVTGEDGSVELTNLVGGETYTLREVEAPLGYALVADATFTVGADGTVTLAGTPAGWSAANADDGTAALTAVDERIGAGITKVSTTGEALGGATFEATGVFLGSDAVETRTVSVPERGATIEGLLAGETYELRETVAPEGYDAIEGTWSFSVAADGTLSAADAQPSAAEGEAGYRVSEDGLSLVAADAPTAPVPGTEGLTRTGDPTRGLLPVAFGVAGLLFVALALHAVRRRRQ